ncbi:MAG TPA: kelch repeat-containing protein [Saprospiraceae bacterium]|nr:kelch repeat-containing protein [Saprospiraceae bacterium]
MKSISALLLISLYFSVNIIAQTFIKNADFPGDARRDVISFTIGDRIYTGGGMNQTKFLKDLWEYNTTSNKWTKKNDLPSTIAIGTSVVANGICYIGLGGDGTKSLKDWWQYDEQNDNWIKKADFPGRPGFDASCVSWKNNIYAIGVSETDNNSRAEVIHNEVWQYCPATNIWSLIDKFPGKPRHSGIAVISENNLIYGFGQNESTKEQYSDMYNYDLENHSLKNIASIPSTPCQPVGTANYAGVYDNKIIMLSTDCNADVHEDYNNLYTYNISSDQWTIYKLANKIPWRLFGLSSTIANNGFTGLGYDYISDIWYRDNWKINLEQLLMSYESKIPEMGNIKVNTSNQSILVELPKDLSLDSNIMLNTLDGKKLKDVSLGDGTEVDLSYLPNNLYVWTILNKGSVIKSGSIYKYK